MATYLELKAKAEKLMEQAEEARKNEISEVVADIKNKMSEYGITASDLGLSTTKKASKKAKPTTPAIVKYKNSEDETWSGMGRMPNWMKDAIEKGKTKESFAV